MAFENRENLRLRCFRATQVNRKWTFCMFGLWFCSSFFEQIASKRVKALSSSKLVWSTGNQGKSSLFRFRFFSFPVFFSLFPNKNRGTQSQFSENICSEDDLGSSIFGNICCKISCLPASPRSFEHTKNGLIAHF